MELDTILRRVDLETGDIGTVEEGGDQGESGGSPVWWTLIALEL